MCQLREDSSEHPHHHVPELVHLAALRASVHGELDQPRRDAARPAKVQVHALGKLVVPGVVAQPGRSHSEQSVVRRGRRFAVHVELLQLRAVDGDVYERLAGSIAAREDVDLV